MMTHIHLANRHDGCAIDPKNPERLEGRTLADPRMVKAVFMAIAKRFAVAVLAWHGLLFGSLFAKKM